MSTANHEATRSEGRGPGGRRGTPGSKQQPQLRQVPPQSVCVVCGGAGFLGSHLCSRLLQLGRDVVCIDNFCTSDRSTVEHLQSHPRFSLLQRDVAVATNDDLGEVDSVFNLACPASPAHYQRSPLDTLYTSVRGMDNLLRLARRTHARVFQASTSEIYGHPTIHPQPEHYWGHVNPVGPRSCYDEGKRCAETLCFIYGQLYAVPVRIGRIFNTYGPGMRLGDGRVVVNFIVQALAGQPLTVYGDGTQTRSFCFVDDLIDAILRLTEAAQDIGPVNLGNPAEIRIVELAELVIRLTGSRSRIRMRPLPKDDPPRRRPDISLAAKALDWQPRIDLAAGLELTIRDVERRLQRNGTGARTARGLDIDHAAPAAGAH